tara:strand:+ start:1873 stop:2307 length:435 start_codon:yes stop_codon:yes gene_type:complete
MTSLKIFIIVGVAFLLGAAGTAGFVWYLVQDTLAPDSTSILKDLTDSEAENVPAAETDIQPAQETQSGSIAETVPEEGIPLPTESLTDGQKAVAEAVGVDVDTFVITPQMVGCIEQKLGTTRTQAIMDGDTPSVIEVARIAGCL